MTATDTETTTAEPTSQGSVSITLLRPHPDNPRRTLGELAELTRSIRAHGVLMPLLVLPADSEGHLIVAGHRRHAAALAAGLDVLPVVVRDMTAVEVVEAMLIENEHRGDLTITEQIAAVERLMDLEEGLTPTKLNKRIGKSKAWVRTRMSLAVLPEKWRGQFDCGDLTVAAAEAATTAADLGPEHLDTLLQRLADSGHWQDPVRAVENYRRDLERDANYSATVERERRRADATVFTNEVPPPATAKSLRELFDDDALAKAHRAEPCHATIVRRVSWGDGAEVLALCTSPRNHRPSSTGDTDGLVADKPQRQGGTDDGPAKRRGRQARTAHLTDAMARTRGGPNRADLTTVALRALIHDAGQEPIKFASTVLGLDATDDQRAALIALADDQPADLVRVAAAIACGLAEASMYWSATSARCQKYLGLLCDSGWTPDDWTAPHIADAPEAER